MPLSIERSLILHCGVNSVCHVYTLDGKLMPTTDVFKELGVLRSSHHHYSGYVASIPASCRRFAGMIQRVFWSRDVDFLRRAFVTYVMLQVMYMHLQLWALFRYQIASLESIQRHFTKYLPGLVHPTYEQQLESLKALSLDDTWMMTDMVFVYRILQKMCDNKLKDVSLSLSSGNEHSGKSRLFRHRAWNQQSGTF